MYPLDRLQMSLQPRGPETSPSTTMFLTEARSAIRTSGVIPSTLRKRILKEDTLCKGTRRNPLLIEDTIRDQTRQRGIRASWNQITLLCSTRKGNEVLNETVTVRTSQERTQASWHQLLQTSKRKIRSTISALPQQSSNHQQAMEDPQPSPTLSLSVSSLLQFRMASLT